MSSFARLWKHHRLLTIAFMLSAALTLLLALRLTVSYVYWSQHINEPVTANQRIGYIARSHRVPSEDLKRAVGLDPSARDRRTLNEIATEQSRDVQSLITTIEAELERLNNAAENPQAKP